MQRRQFVQASLGTLAWLPAGALLARQASAATQPADLQARTLTGGAATLPGVDIADFAAGLRGQVLLPADAGYDTARKVWNGAFDKHPALIARCSGAADVRRCVQFAHAHQLLTAVRAGGHSSSGKSTCEGGILIDLSPMQGVQIDPLNRTARVNAGALLGQLDHETAAFGLVTTAGTISDTGAAGLTLGGGVGRLARRFALACDNLRAANLVTADGRFVRASEQENADLLWGLRGGGGNFGVVTLLEYRLHEMNPTILGGTIRWPLEQAREVLRFHADFSMSAPDVLNTDVAVVRPPTGDPFIEIEACWCGDHSKGEQALRPLRQLGRPREDAIALMPYVKLQSSADAFFPHGLRRYVKSAFTRALSAQALDTVLEVFLGTPHELAIIFAHSGGAIGRVPTGATAFVNRDSRYWMIAISNWTDPEDSEPRVASMRRLWKELEPFGYGYYVNALTEDEESKEREVYGSNYARLAALKKKYDPANLFRLNANVTPAL